MIKLLFDKFSAGMLLIILSPIILIVAVLIRLKLGSPILFIQVRPGLHAEPFALYKFRTMIDQYDAEGNLLPDELRLTSFGKKLRKLSIDELPQLLNVVKGELSLVGPRPLLMEYLPLYSHDQFRRHEVKPGMTGWAQVNGRNAISWEDKFKLDIWYVDHQSFWLDLKILWLTFLKVVKREGISQTGHATMKKFNGNGRDL